MVAHLSGSSVSCAVIFLFATLHEGKLLLVEIVEMSNLMGNDVKSLGIRPREDLLCLFVCFPF